MFSIANNPSERYSSNRLQDAEQILLAILDAAFQGARAWQLLGSTLALQGFCIAAEQMYVRALQLNPNDPYSLSALAEMALDALRWEDAKPWLQRLFELDSDGQHPAANRGRRVLRTAHRRLGGEN